MSLLSIILMALAAGCADAQLRYFNNIQDFQTSLQPVQGLYVQPASDGQTGDLFVAATEQDGVQTPWISDSAVKIAPEEEKSKEKINKGNVAAVAMASAERIEASQPQELSKETQQPFVQVPQQFYYQLMAAAMANQSRAKNVNDVEFRTPGVEQGVPLSDFTMPQVIIVDPSWLFNMNQDLGAAPPLKNVKRSCNCM